MEVRIGGTCDPPQNTQRRPGAEGISSQIIVLKRRPVARIEAKSMTHRSVYPNLISQWIIAFEFACGFSSIRTAGDSGVLDNDCIILDIILFSSNQIV